MDVFDGSVQTHDFNPGITPQGVFWTIPFAEGAVRDINVGAGAAEMQATNVDVDDYFNLVNALLVQSGQTGNHTPDEIPALVTFKINWHTVHDRFHVENAAETFDASVVLNESSVEWSAHEAASDGAPSFSFQSTSSTNVFSMLAKERNGRFFNS
jgi:hypothetical protein